jgi:hypothetical protein
VRVSVVCVVVVVVVVAAAAVVVAAAAAKVVVVVVVVVHRAPKAVKLILRERSAACINCRAPHHVKLVRFGACVQVVVVVVVVG